MCRAAPCDILPGPSLESASGEQLAWGTEGGPDSLRSGLHTLGHVCHAFPPTPDFSITVLLKGST